MYCNEFNCTTWESGSTCCVFLHTDSLSKSLCVVHLKTETLILVLNCFTAAVDRKICPEKKKKSTRRSHSQQSREQNLFLSLYDWVVAGYDTHFFPISRGCFCLPTDKQACPDPSCRACVTTHRFHFNTLRCRNNFFVLFSHETRVSQNDQLYKSDALLMFFFFYNVHWTPYVNTIINRMRHTAAAKHVSQQSDTNAENCMLSATWFDMPELEKLMMSAQFHFSSGFWWTLMGPNRSYRCARL